MSEISQPSTTSTPIPLPSLADAAIIANLKQQLDTAQQQLDSTQQRLQFAELKVQMLEEKLRLQRIAKYGPSSEKLATLQMELLEEEPGVSDEEVQAESQRERLAAVEQGRLVCNKDNIYSVPRGQAREMLDFTMPEAGHDAGTMLEQESH